MNSYTLDELYCGLQASFTVTVTEEMIDTFCSLSGDVSPIHVDRAYAQEHGFSNRVAQGLLVSSFYSTLAGVYLPGEHCLLQSIDIVFNKPVYPDDVLHVSGEITLLHEALKVAEIKAHITREDGTKVSRAKLRAGIRQ